MNKLIAIIAALSLTSCSWFKHEVAPVVTDVIVCTQLESNTISDGGTWFQTGMLIVEAIDNAIANNEQPQQIATQLFAEYGEPVVACILNDLDIALPAAAPMAAVKRKAFANAAITAYRWKFAPRKAPATK